ncbi:beta-N-acetylglucosaminidase domain-containing protein [Streptomyces sp. M600PL45_2]|uniref:Beta-N-acetylglucosaminidase domain-containing protein n=1 Tax=Streptomyces marispadix TaxID=2922868 RepID=A0ABS9SX72_9ACTN|nr:beta-N-acetylglucosaminidase domain-containing protein [Streptomyces marispadix]
MRRGADIPLPRRASVVTGAHADRPARRALLGVLREAGVQPRTATEAEAEREAAGRPGSALTVFLGVPGQNPAVGRALRDMDVRGPGGLPSGGYALASGRAPGRPGSRLVLAGADGSGTYYAVQTLRQLISGRPGTRPAVPSLTVRDRPRMRSRGAIEGFYGKPWSQRDRLRQLDFYGAHKMNTYIYAPKDDPYHREKWREPYPAAKLRELAELNRRADARHVDFVFSVSPGLDVCYSDPAELRALRKKAGALWDIGVRDFGLFFDDIDPELKCARDKERFGDDPDPSAAAQAHLLNEFQRTFLDPREGAGRLSTVPTEYSGTESSPYRKRFAKLVGDEIVLYWTGPEVVSPTVGDEDAEAAADVFRHDLILWDNYPVNDFLPRRLFLGPLKGRSRTLDEHGIVGLAANPMPQAEPSKVGLATAGDYAWNPAGYRPGRSWEAALRDIGGRARDALRTFADNSRSSDLGRTESPRLATRIEDFWRERRQQPPAPGSQVPGSVRNSAPVGAPAPARARAGGATEALIAEFTAMARAREELRSGLDDPAFAEQAGPWLTKLRRYGEAGAAAARSLAAQRDGDGRLAWQERVKSVRAAKSAHRVYESVAPGVMDRFLDDAASANRVVDVDAPKTAPAGSPVTLGAEVHAGRTPVEKVEFRAGSRKIGVAESPPYRVRWDSAPEGLHLVTARAVARDGESVTSPVARLKAGEPDPVLLLVGDDAPVPEGESLSSGDAAVRDRLEHLGHPVEVARGEDSRPGDARGKAAVVISSTLSSGSVGSKFRDADVPVLTWEAQVLDDMRMATGPGETFGVEKLHVTDPDSPLAAGLSGDTSVYRGKDRLRWARPAAGAETAASPPGDPDDAALFGYRTGDPMVEMKAPAPRVALFLSDEGLTKDVVTGDAVRLFDASVRWALDERGP